MPERTYSVYLIQREGSQGGERQVTSPVQGSKLDFYESGVWLTREAGRNFFPYDEIRTIREHPAEEETDGETRTEPEQRSEADRGNAAERDPGAEEDLVE